MLMVKTFTMIKFLLVNNLECQLIKMEVKSYLFNENLKLLTNLNVKIIN
jgi:hypothetical protein